MGRDSDKRRLTHFAKPRPGTLGKMWQQPPRKVSGTDTARDDWLLGEQASPEEQCAPGTDDARRPDQPEWKTLPQLPHWPPLPEEDPFGPGRYSESDSPKLTESTSEQPAPEWIPDRSELPEQPTRRLERRPWPLTRRLRLGLVAGAVVVLLVCSLVSALALSNALRPHTSALGAASHPGGQTTSATDATPTAARATATATAAPASNTQAPPTFTVAFTCASGVIGGTGQVCVHTQPNAALSLSVRYCDGNYAKGKGLHGAVYANGSGDFTWNWDVSTSCAGNATATVTARSSGQTVTASTTFTVTR